jgi:hypothetical protein
MESTPLNSDWTALLLGLNAAEVRYLIVGAHAVGIYANPRATGDLDIWIERTRDNARRTHDALVAFGAPIGELKAEELEDDDLIFMFGVPPLRIDILTDISGVSFEDAWSQRVDGRLGEVPVAFIGRYHLIANKRATGRTKDLADVEALEQS